MYEDIEVETNPLITEKKLLRKEKKTTEEKRSRRRGKRRKLRTTVTAKPNKTNIKITVKFHELFDSSKQYNIHAITSITRRKEEARKKCEEIMTKNLPNLIQTNKFAYKPTDMRSLNNPNKINLNNATPKHSIFPVLKLILRKKDV